MIKKLKCFKSYDIRGVVPEELDYKLAYKIAIAYANIIKPNSVIVGYDARLQSPMLAKFLILGLKHSSVNVVNIGLCGTEEVYFHTWSDKDHKIDGGIMITASHNPKVYNGMKMVKSNSRPISRDDLNAIHNYLLNNKFEINMETGNYIERSDKSLYISHLLSYVDINKLKPLKIVVNPGNGTAGIIIKLLEKSLPFQFIYIHDEVNGNFPNGVPNPMLPENRKITSALVKKHNADFGIAWDGDFDRCFFFDETGAFISGYYIVGLLSYIFLKSSPNSNTKIVHDERLIWNTQDIIKSYRAISVLSKAGHSFMKEKIYTENAVYGGECSSHHYFKDFGCCDSGMLPWLLISELLCNKNYTLSQMLKTSRENYRCSDEINYRVRNIDKVINNIENYFKPMKPIINYTDGISVEFPNWRFNLRASNTESFLRLNIETRAQNNISIQKIMSEIESIISPSIAKI